MTDPLKPDPLLRKQNTCLQKQLDLTVQILSEEYRQCKERAYKDERDCGKFLQSLYETVPGLQNYGHPNTRSMSASALLIERHRSSGVSEDTETSSASGTDGHSQPSHHSSRAQRSTSNYEAGDSRQQQARWIKNRTNRKLGSGSGPFGRASQGGGGGNGVRDIQTPKTADSYKPQRLLSQDDRSDRPRSSYGFRKCTGPSLGKNAYSDHERLVQEMVLKKFHLIFDPEVRKATTSTTATLITMPAAFQDTRRASDDQRSSSTDDTDDQDLDAASGDVVKVTKVNGEERGVHHKQHGRRVLWSADACRKVASVTAPDIDGLESPASQNPSVVVSGYVKPRSNSLSLPRRGYRTGTNRGHSVVENTPVDPKIRALALQWDLSDDGQLNGYLSEHNTHGESGEHSTSKALHGSQGATDQGAQGRSRLTQTTSRPLPLNKSKSDTSILKKHHSHGHSKMDSSPHANGSSATHETKRRSSVINASSHRRLSEASLMLNPEQLVDKLMNAGRQPCGLSRRPKTAPNSRSELSHRIVPMSRKTIVGILSEIENQKASTRNLVTSSKELQQYVKKLVPYEYLLDDDSD